MDNKTPIRIGELTRSDGAGEATAKGSGATVPPRDGATSAEVVPEKGPAITGSYHDGDTVDDEKGRIIMGLYRIESDPFVGGFGRVFRVHHTGWNVDLAMKQPRREVFSTEKQKEDFKEECKRWINLGLHPNVVSCYYVREIDGIPSVFAEWMDGGSLRDRIKNKSLYEGSEKEQLERVLDISIQVARGLYYAHEHDPEKVLIHQDVKPENLLLATDGTAKVADFGIAGAKARVAELELKANAGRRDTIVVRGQGYTPAYCSPEQKEGKGLTRRTDIWSWAASVLEMFLGDRPWHDDGTDAGRYCENGKIPMPEAMKDLLRRCFRKDESERPHDFAEVEKALLAIYSEETGKDYWRPLPKAAADTADSLNNHALSFLDLEMPEKAEEYWAKALEKQPEHPDSVFNKAVYLWRKARIDDLQANDMIKNMYENSQDKARAILLYVNFCLERCDYNTAATLYKPLKEYISDRDFWRYLDVLDSQSEKIGYDSLYYINNKLNYTGLFRIVDNGTAIVSCSWQGVEKWKLNYPDQDIPEKARRIYKYNWPEEQIKVLAISNDGKYILTHAGKEKENAEEIKRSRLPLTKNNLAHILFKELSAKEQEKAQHIPHYSASLIDSFIYKHYMLGIDEYMHLENGKAICLWKSKKESRPCKFESELFENSQPKAACFDPDNPQVMTVSWSDGENNYGELDTWNMKTGKNVRKVRIDEKEVTAIAFSPDTKLLLTGNNYGEVRLFDTHTGRLLKTFREMDESKHVKKLLAAALEKLFPEAARTIPSITGVYFMPDSSCVCAVDSNGAYSQWDIASCRLICNHQKGFDRNLYFSPDNKHLYSVFSSVKFMDITTGRCLRTQTDFFPNHITFLSNTRYAITTPVLNEEFTKKGILCIENPDFERIPDIIWSISKIVSTRDLLQQEQLFRQTAESSKTCIANGNIEEALIHLENAFNIPYISKVAELQKLNDEAGKYCRIAKVRSITQIKIPETLKKTKNHYAFNSKGYILDRENLYDIINDKHLQTFEKSFRLYAFSPDNKFVYGTTDASSHTIVALDVQTGKYSYTFDGTHDGIINTVRVSRDGQYLLTGSEDKTAKLWDVKKRKCISTFVHEQAVKDAHFGPESRTAVTISSPFSKLHGEVLLWNIHDAKIKSTIHKDACSIRTNHNGTKLLVGVVGGIERFDLQNCLFIAKCKNENENEAFECPSEIRFLPDERFALSISSKGNVHHWDLSENKPIASFQSKGIFMDLHPDGNYVLDYVEENCLLRIEYQYEFPGWHDWDEGARPYLDTFLTLHPDWTDDDFDNILIPDLQNRGYGWLRPKGVKAELKKSINHHLN